MKVPNRRHEWIDYLPFVAIWAILIVCALTDLILLKKPVYLLSTLPLAIITILAGIRKGRGRIFGKEED